MSTTPPTSPAPSAHASAPLSVSSSELAGLLGAQLLGSGEVSLRTIAAVELAGDDALTFVRSHKHARLFAASGAAAAIITPDISLADLVTGFDPGAPQYPRPILIVPDVDFALIRCAAVFSPPSTPPPPGIHPSAFVDAAARIDAAASIGPNCTVLAGATVGPNSVLIANVHLGAHVAIGAHTTLHPGVVVLDRCTMGDHCIMQPNVSLGGDGFGYRPAPDGRGLVKIPHIGNVSIGNHVEIGASSCIDRAKFGSTIIGDGTKIDNLVQVGHGCRIGRSCILCGHVGLAGSVVIGDGAQLGGKVGVADNVEIGAGARIAAGAGVSNHVPAGAVYMGVPAGPIGEWRRIYAHLRRLGKRSGVGGE